MRKIFTITLLCMAILFTVKMSSAYAVLIDFESFAESALVSGSGKFSDFIFSTNPSYNIVATDVVTGQLYPLLADFGGKMAAISSDYSYISNYRADFLIPGVNYVSLVMGDYNTGMTGADSDGLFLRAYDSSNNLISQAAYTLNPSEGNVGHTLVVSGSNINYVAFGSTGVAPNSIYFDNFQYNAVPEPASLSLLGLGLLGLLLKRKKIA